MDFNQIWHVFAIGFAILILAIILNVLANWLGITTWFGFLANFKEIGWRAFSKAGFLSIVFMFVIYPGLLGAGGYYLSRLLL